MPTKKPASSSISTSPSAKATKPSGETPQAKPDKVQGPASYFPSIEKKYGRPIVEWKALIRSSGITKHMEIVNWLKAEHEMGHGHANALVAHTLADDAVG